jgi:hypothetical protein
MNTDIRIAISFKGHRKRKKLERILGSEAVLALIDLWIGTAMNHPEGKLTGMDELDISLEANWEGDPRKFVKTLIDVGFLDRDQDGTYSLHDWNEHQPWVVGAKVRSERARKASQARWGSPMKCQEHATSIKEASSEHADGNAPFLSSPNPSLPIVERENAAKSAHCLPPYEDIREAWNMSVVNMSRSRNGSSQPTTTLPRIKILSDERKDKIKQLWSKFPDQTIWQEVFRKANDSRFLTQTEKYIRKTCPDWRANFDWIIQESNFIKVLEGNYDKI